MFMVVFMMFYALNSWMLWMRKQKCVLIISAMMMMSIVQTMILHVRGIVVLIILTVIFVSC